MAVTTGPGGRRRAPAPPFRLSNPSFRQRAAPVVQMICPVRRGWSRNQSVGPCCGFPVREGPARCRPEFRYNPGCRGGRLGPTTTRPPALHGFLQYRDPSVGAREEEHLTCHPRTGTVAGACRQTLRQQPHARVTVLFGSRALGTAHPDSDRDIAIVLEGDELRHLRPARSVFPRSELPADLPHVDVQALSEDNRHRNARAPGTLPHVVCHDGKVLAGEWSGLAGLAAARIVARSSSHRRHCGAPGQGSDETARRCCRPEP